MNAILHEETRSRNSLRVRHLGAFVFLDTTRKKGFLHEFLCRMMVSDAWKCITKQVPGMIVHPRFEDPGGLGPRRSR